MFFPAQIAIYYYPQEICTFNISLFLLGCLNYFPVCIVLSERGYSVFLMVL
jgi:hypothetical protein